MPPDPAVELAALRAREAPWGGDIRRAAAIAFSGSRTMSPGYTPTATVLYAHELGVITLTTSAYSLQSYGMAEAFVKTFTRDYVARAELRDADSVLALLSG